MAERFWHEIEGRPWEEVRAIQEAKLRRQMTSRESASEFYRFEKPGVQKVSLIERVPAP